MDIYTQTSLSHQETTGVVAELLFVKAKVNLIKPLLYGHIRKSTTTKEKYTNLKTLLSDSKFSRRTPSLCHYYVTQIVDNTLRLSGTEFQIYDERVRSSLLAGLQFIIYIFAIDNVNETLRPF